MQLSSAIASCLLAATALSSPIHHAHKREADPEAAVEYVTVYNTFYVTEHANAAIPPPAATAVVEHVADAVPAPQVTSVDLPEKPLEPAAPSSASAPAPAVTSSAPTVPNEGSGSAGALGITYSPYTNEGGCKSSSQVADEVARLSGYNVIRLYGTDCDQVQNVFHAKAPHQKLFLGVFHMGNIENEIQTMADALGGDWSSVETVSIGNELVNGGQANVDQVAGYLSTGRAKLSSVGYTGPVVSVDTFIATINNPGLCRLSDYMAVNAHAYFDGGVTSSEAGKWALEQIQRVWSACGGEKPVTIVESGWPSRGNSNGVAVASPEDQAIAIKSLKESVGNDVYLFTAYNDLWKAPGYLNIENWFGILGSSAY